MTSDGQTTPSGVEAAERAQQALLNRPKFSLRARLTTGFTAWFILTAGLAIAAILTLSGIENKIRFTEAVDRYTFEVQQARRFEKNFFLYGTNVTDALDHVHNAQIILEGEQDDIRTVIGQSGLLGMMAHMELYEGLLSRLHDLATTEDPTGLPEYDEIEAGLRDNGAVMVAEAENLVDRERAAVSAMLRNTQSISLAFVIILLLLIAYLTFFIARQMMAPLNRMMGVAERIADGDFTPILPHRKYFDEFSKLAVAMNHMMIQLEHRYELLVQAHKMQAVGTLTAGVAHELNNPINNIMITAETLHEEYGESSDDERLEMVRDLVGESERARKIVRNLLDFARESNLETEFITPQHLVEETLQLATNQLKLGKVKVVGEIEDNLPAIHGDFQQLSQVFLNLVLNAIDAMPDGGTLIIGIAVPRARDHVIFTFSDTGTGMPDRVMANIFDPFFTTKPGAKGTGLGLSVSLGIVQQHGGDIQVESSPGEGTTFTVIMPVTKVPASIDTSRDILEDELIT